jgi:hypothetical protein
MPTPHRILGLFRITEMEMWDQDFVNAEVEGYFRFESAAHGEFQFGFVCGQMTLEHTTRGGEPAVEWSWKGNDEMDEARGRGWAILQKDGSLKGKIFLHQGNSSTFTAIRKTKAS